MDYRHRRRLKLWGRARVVHAADDPDLMKRLALPDYDAEVERGIVIHIEAIDWNCPQHITPRYTEAEMSEILKPLIEEARQKERKMK